MEEAELFLAGHAEASRIAILACGDEAERIEEFFQYTDLEDCCIVCQGRSFEIRALKERILDDAAGKRMPLPDKLTFSALRDFHGMGDLWGLCVFGAMASDILPLLAYRPRYLLGSIRDDAVNSFHIWEKCRKFCDVVILKTYREGKEPIVLDWRKQAENGVELSVVFPVYNVAAYIEKCLATVTAWTADYVEFIFVSDGSPDGSADIIRKWMGRDGRIRLIEKENGGCASARQTGLDAARGRYVGFVDPDDFVDRNMFRRLLKAAMRGSYDISLCGYNEYYESSGRIKPAEDSLWYPYLDGCHNPSNIIELITYCRVAIWRGIYRKEFLLRHHIGFYTDIRRFDDLPFKVETFAFAKSVIMLKEYLYYYRLEREGQDVSADDERLYVHFEIFRHLDESIGASGNQRLIDNLQMCKLQTHRYALDKIQERLKTDYRRRAKEDLGTLCDFKRTYKIAEIMLGKKVAEDYRKIMQNQ